MDTWDCCCQPCASVATLGSASAELGAGPPRIASSAGDTPRAGASSRSLAISADSIIAEASAARSLRHVPGRIGAGAAAAAESDCRPGRPPVAAAASAAAEASFLVPAVVPGRATLPSARGRDEGAASNCPSWTAGWEASAVARPEASDASVSWSAPRPPCHWLCPPACRCSSLLSPGPRLVALTPAPVASVWPPATQLRAPSCSARCCVMAAQRCSSASDAESRSEKAGAEARRPGRGGEQLEEAAPGAASAPPRRWRRAARTGPRGLRPPDADVTPGRLDPDAWVTGPRRLPVPDLSRRRRAVVVGLARAPALPSDPAEAAIGAEDASLALRRARCSMRRSAAAVSSAAATADPSSRADDLYAAAPIAVRRQAGGFTAL